MLYKLSLFNNLNLNFKIQNEPICGFNIVVFI